MYELIILALLTRWPLHGYLIAKITNDTLGPYARLSNGRLYPLLAKLEAAGLIVTTEDKAPASDARRLRRYAITDEGRRRVHELLMDTTSNLGDYQRVFWYKLPVLDLLTLKERLYLLDHYINYCQSHIFHYTAEIADLPAHHEHFQQSPATYLQAVQDTLDHTLRRWRLELEDALQWRARIVASAEQAGERAGERAGEQVDGTSAAAGAAGSGQRENGSRRTTHQAR